MGFSRRPPERGVAGGVARSAQGAAGRAEVYRGVLEVNTQVLFECAVQIRAAEDAAAAAAAAVQDATDAVAAAAAEEVAQPAQEPLDPWTPPADVIGLEGRLWPVQICAKVRSVRQSPSLTLLRSRSDSGVNFCRGDIENIARCPPTVPPPLLPRPLDRVAKRHSSASTQPFVALRWTSCASLPTATGRAGLCT